VYRSVVAKSEHIERKLRGLEHNMISSASKVKRTRYLDFYQAMIVLWRLDRDSCAT
jgi:hypothetical protein